MLPSPGSRDPGRREREEWGGACSKAEPRPLPEGTRALGPARACAAAILCVATPAARACVGLVSPRTRAPRAEAAAVGSPWLGARSQPPWQGDRSWPLRSSLALPAPLGWFSPRPGNRGRGCVGGMVAGYKGAVFCPPVLGTCCIQSCVSGLTSIRTNKSSGDTAVPAWAVASRTNNCRVMTVDVLASVLSTLHTLSHVLLVVTTCRRCC